MHNSDKRQFAENIAKVSGICAQFPIVLHKKSKNLFQMHLL